MGEQINDSHTVEENKGIRFETTNILLIERRLLLMKRAILGKGREQKPKHRRLGRERGNRNGSHYFKSCDEDLQQ